MFFWNFESLFMVSLKLSINLGKALHKFLWIVAFTCIIKTVYGLLSFICIYKLDEICSKTEKRFVRICICSFVFVSDQNEFKNMIFIK